MYSAAIILINFCIFRRLRTLNHQRLNLGVRRMPGFHCRWAWLPLLLGMAAAGFSQERGEESSGDKGAVRRAAEQFIAALHRGDAETLVAMWTEEGDFVDSTGTVTKGR